MKTLEFSAPASVEKLSTKRQERQGATALNVTLALTCVLPVEVLDSLSSLKQDDPDLLRNAAPWGHLYDDDGVPFALSVKDVRFATEIHGHYLELTYRPPGGGVSKAREWPCTLDGFVAVPWVDRQVALSFKAKFEPPLLDAAFLASALVADGADVKVSNGQRALSLGES